MRHCRIPAKNLRLRREEGARSERKCSLGSAPNNAMLVTAARFEFGVKPKGDGWARAAVAETDAGIADTP